MKTKYYSYYDWFGDRCDVSLERNSIHHNHRCPRDGVRLIAFDGDPHNVVECPNCQWCPGDCTRYNKKKDIKEIEEQIKKHKKEIDKLEAMLLVVSHEINIIRLRNLKT